VRECGGSVGRRNIVSKKDRGMDRRCVYVSLCVCEREREIGRGK